MTYCEVGHFFCLFFVQINRYTVIAQFNYLPCVNFCLTLVKRKQKHPKCLIYQQKLSFSKSRN